MEQQNKYSNCPTLCRLSQESRCYSNCICEVQQGQTHAPDSLTSWFVCLAGLLSSAVVHGSCYTFGILYPTLLLEFNQSKGITALVGSLAMSFMCFFGPVAAKLINRFGCRSVTIFGGLTCAVSFALTSLIPSIPVMFLTYSVLFGFGGCCVYSAVYCEIPRHFHKRRSTAIGFMACGPGAGLFIMSVVVEALQGSLGLKGTYLSLAAINMCICIFGCAFGFSVQEITRVDDCTTERKVTDCVCTEPVPIYRNPVYMIYVISSGISVFGLYIPMIHVAKHGEEIGISLEKSSLLYVASGVSDIFTRIISGGLSDSNCLSMHRMYQISLLVQGGSTLLLPLATTFARLLVYFVVWGLAMGVTGTCIVVLLLTSVHKGQEAQALGLWNFSMSLALISGPPLAGFLADKFASYVPVFYCAGAVILTGGCVVFLHNCSCFKQSSSNTLENETFVDTVVVLERETAL